MQSSHHRERNDLPALPVGRFRIAVTSAESPAEPGDGVLTDWFLHVEVMLGHVDVRVSHKALDCGEVNSQRLHLTHIRMTA